MNLKENIAFFLGSHEDAYKIILTKLNKYDVENLDNLINLISYMDDNEFFIDFNNVVEHVRNLDGFKYKKDPIFSSNNVFVNMACSQLDNPKFQFLRSSKFLVNLPVFEATLMLIELNFYFYSNDDIKSIPDVVKLVFDGNIICYFTFFVDEFKKEKALPSFSEDFFDKISKITFNSEISKELDNIINKYIILVGEHIVSLDVNNSIIACAKYLMACNALKHKRNGVSCEDVVVGYTLALKLLTEDIREYVIKYYVEDLNLKISDFEVDKNNYDIQDNRIGFKSVVSIIFAILAFLEVIIVITIIIEILGFEFSNNPLIRLPTLIVSFYVARKFYNYLIEGNDKNLFENGKSKAMIIFIMIFIITIIIGYI